MPEILTHADAVQHVLDVFDVNDARGQKLARTAVRSAYRDLPNKHRWSYLNRRGTLLTSAPYSTGTIEYDHTGGASERLVTLTSGTWPTWAQYGTLIVASQPYKVYRRLSSTTLQLDAVANPGDDIASGTSYSLCRTQYPVPAGFRRISELLDAGTSECLLYVPPTQIAMAVIRQVSAGRPELWTVRGVTNDYPGSLAIEFWPPPSTARTYQYLFANECRALSLPPETDGGTVTTTSTAVAGSSTNFTADCVGAVIRFSDNDTDLPTSLSGGKPYAHQAIITARTSATAITIDTAPTTDLSGVLYTLSDPIDIEPGAMQSYFLRLIEAEYATLVQHKDRGLFLQLATEALRMAMAADYRPMDMTTDDYAARFYWQRLRDLRASD